MVKWVRIKRLKSYMKLDKQNKTYLGIAGAILVIIAIIFIGKKDVEAPTPQEPEITEEETTDTLTSGYTFDVPALVINEGDVKSCAFSIETPKVLSKVTFPLTITGEIVPSLSCPWVKFEGMGGTIKLKDIDGNVIAGPVGFSAGEEWMNTNPFPVSVTIDSVSESFSGDIIYVYLEDANAADSSESPTKYYTFPVKY
jgi:hypothetical protein